MDYYSAVKRQEILASATTEMDPEGIMISEISQRKKRHCIISLLRGIQKIPTKKSLGIDMENSLGVARVVGGWEIQIK